MVDQGIKATGHSNPSGHRTILSRKPDKATVTVAEYFAPKWVDEYLAKYSSECLRPIPLIMILYIWLAFLNVAYAGWMVVPKLGCFETKQEALNAYFSYENPDTFSFTDRICIRDSCAINSQGTGYDCSGHCTLYATGESGYFTWSGSFSACDKLIDPPKNSGGGGGCIKTPKPIHTATGNKYWHEIDYQNSMTKLSFERFYNSDGISLRSHIGRNWQHEFDRQVLFSPNGSSSATVSVYRADGRYYRFEKSGANWIPDSDVNLKLAQLFAGITPNGWQITSTNDDIETYDVSGKLIVSKDHTGLSTTLTYSDATTPVSVAPRQGFLIRVTDNFGNSLNFTYNSAGQMATMTNPAGKVYSYGYDTSGNLKTVTYPDETPSVLTDNPKKTYVYGSDAGELVNTANVSQPNALTGIIDEKGFRTMTYQYDANGKAYNEFSSGNIDKYSLAYAPDGTSTAVTEPLGAIRTTHFTTVLGVVKSTGTDQPGGSGCSAASSAMTYDANGNVASRSDFNGHKVCYAYDLSRNLETARVEGLASTADCAASLSATTLVAPAHKVSTEWHPSFRLPTKITEPGLETSYSYDSKGNTTHKGLKDLVTTKVRAWDTSYTYSASGILLQKAEDGPRTDVADVVTYDYYPEDAACTGSPLGCRGQLKQVTDALGHVTKINRYSANGQPEVTVDPNGLTSTMAYDARQRLISMDVGGETTTYSYDLAGLMTKATQPNGAYLAYTYDNGHRLIKVKDQLGNTRTYTLDNMGNRLKEDLTDPNGQLARSQTKVYDALSRLQNLVLPQ